MQSQTLWNCYLIIFFPSIIALSLRWYNVYLSIKVKLDLMVSRNGLTEVAYTYHSPAYYLMEVGYFSHWAAHKICDRKNKTWGHRLIGNLFSNLQEIHKKNMIYPHQEGSPTLQLKQTISNKDWHSTSSSHSNCGAAQQHTNPALYLQFLSPPPCFLSTLTIALQPPTVIVTSDVNVVLLSKSHQLARQLDLHDHVRNQPWFAT